MSPVQVLSELLPRHHYIQFLQHEMSAEVLQSIVTVIDWRLDQVGRQVFAIIQHRGFLRLQVFVEIIECEFIEVQVPPNDHLDSIPTIIETIQNR